MNAVSTRGGKLTGWRMKDRYRFRNPDLVAIRYSTDCRAVFDLHEAICDLIDEERENCIRVSLLTLATMIHDFPHAGEWEEARIAAIEGMRERGLICFDGAVTLYDELEISLPERVWHRWHESGKRHAANLRPVDPSTGRFVPKTPAPTPSSPSGSPVDPERIPSGSPGDPSKTETKAKTKKEKTDLSPSVPKDDLPRRLFEHWLKATGRNANQNRLTKKRVGLVKARKKDGYSDEQLFAAIDGIAASDWHAGRLNGTRYDTFDFIFRDGENVEKGLDRSTSATNQDAVQAAGGVDLEATRQWYLEQGFDPAEVDRQIAQREQVA